MRDEESRGAWVCYFCGTPETIMYFIAYVMTNAPHRSKSNIILCCLVLGQELCKLDQELVVQVQEVLDL